MRPGEIYLAKFPFGDAPGMKIRPVLLLTEPVGVVLEACLPIQFPLTIHVTLRCTTVLPIR